jgi:hypothetical protein
MQVIQKAAHIFNSKCVYTHLFVLSFFAGGAMTPARISVVDFCCIPPAIFALRFAVCAVLIN